MRGLRQMIPVAMLWLSACASDAPEDALERVVGEAAAAAEARETAFFRDLIADGYADAQGNDRERMIDLIRGYFFVNPAIDVFTRIESIELEGTDAAQVVVLAGILGRRPGDGLLDGFDGHLYRVELELVESGDDWHVIGARWERSLRALIGE